MLDQQRVRDLTGTLARVEGVEGDHAPVLASTHKIAFLGIKVDTNVVSSAATALSQKLTTGAALGSSAGSLIRDDETGRVPSNDRPVPHFVRRITPCKGKPDHPPERA